MLMVTRHLARPVSPAVSLRFTVALCFCLLMQSGCASHDAHLRDIREEFFAGRIDDAQQLIATRLEKPRQAGDVLKLEQAIVDLSSGNPARAEQTMREVRDNFDFLEQKSLGEEAKSLLTDDNRRAYAGEDYEKILVRAMLALSSLMQDGADAEAYSLQVAQKQQEVLEKLAESKPEAPAENASVATGADQPAPVPTGPVFKQVALGAYVRGVLEEQTHRNFDVAAKEYFKVVSWQPEFRPGSLDLERAQHGRHSQPGNGVLYVFAMVGRGPYKVQVSEIPSSAALVIAEITLGALGHRLPPTVAPIRVPQVVVPHNNIQSVRVSVDGRIVGNSETITDVGQLAVEQYAAVRPKVVARAVVRRAVKKGTVYSTQQALAGDTVWGQALGFVTGVAWEATEAADTRCWGLLPAQIQVLRVELPAGVHNLAVTPANGHVSFGVSSDASVRILDGRNTYVLVNMPVDRVVGQIVTNEPAGLDSSGSVSLPQSPAPAAQPKFPFEPVPPPAEQVPPPVEQRPNENRPVEQVPPPVPQGPIEQVPPPGSF